MNRYKALLKVVEVGSYTKAAEILGYTHPGRPTRHTPQVYRRCAGRTRP